MKKIKLGIQRYSSSNTGDPELACIYDYCGSADCMVLDVCHTDNNGCYISDICYDDNGGCYMADSCWSDSSNCIDDHCIMDNNDCSFDTYDGGCAPDNPSGGGSSSDAGSGTWV